MEVKDIHTALRTHAILTLKEKMSQSYLTELSHLPEMIKISQGILISTSQFYQQQLIDLTKNIKPDAKDIDKFTLLKGLQSQWQASHEEFTKKIASLKERYTQLQSKSEQANQIKIKTQKKLTENKKVILGQFFSHWRKIPTLKTTEQPKELSKDKCVIL